MIRIGPLVLALFASGAALAQPTPRVVFDTELPSAAGQTPNYNVLGLPLAIGADGIHYVLQHQYVPGTQTEAKAASIDLLAVASNGKFMFRRSLPLQAKMDFNGLAVNSLGVAAAGPDDVAVFAAPRERDGAPTPNAPFATLLRLGADGNVKNSATLGAPRAVANADFQHANYNLRVMVPTPDNTLLLGGGFGGPLLSAWWLSKVSLDGTRIWLADGAKGRTGQVTAVGPRPNGNWLTLGGDGGHHDHWNWDVRLRSATGKQLAQYRGPTLPAFHSAVLRQGAVLAETYNHEEPSRRLVLVFIDDAGKVRRRLPWPFPLTHGLIADGDGFAGIVGAGTDIESKRFVFRADAQGNIKWRVESNADVIVRAPDGHLVALVKWGDEETRRRLVKFADP